LVEYFLILIDFLTSHLEKTEVENLITSHSNGFRNERYKVHVTTGNVFTPMQLIVHLFNPKGFYFCEQQHLPTGETSYPLELVCRYSAPVGLMGIDSGQLENRCMKYIESMVNSPIYVDHVTQGDKSQLRQDILRAIFKYIHNQEEEVGKINKTFGSCLHTQTYLLKGALKLHAMHYSMTKLVTFVPESTAILSPVVPEGWGSQKKQFISSKLLNRQVKVAIHRQLKKAQVAILEGYEKELRKRTKAAWPIAFSVVLILCLCAEDIQIAAENFASYAEDGCPTDRTKSRDACVQLETLSYEQCGRLFHEVFATLKKPTGHGGKGSFNPLVQEPVSATGLSLGAQQLVCDIKIMLKSHCRSSKLRNKLY
jgi:hypothetical protein